MERKAYPSDVSDAEWALVAPHLTLMTEDAPQRDYPLREVFNGLRWMARGGSSWRMMPHDLPPYYVVYQQMRRWLKAGVFEAIAELAERVQAETGETVEIAYVDQGYTGVNAADAAAEHGIQLEVAKLPEAKRGFVLLPRRWVVERSFGWMSRFRRLARDYERLPETLAGLHYLAFVILMLKNVVEILT
jgi:transposase